MDLPLPMVSTDRERHRGTAVGVIRHRKGGAIVRRGTVATMLALFLGLIGALAPSDVRACISDHPTFTEVVRGARAIARVTIVDGFDMYTEDPTHSETYRVERVFKGSVPDVVTVTPAWTSLCHDTVGYYAGDAGVGSDGKTIIVALELRYYDQLIHPMWVAGGDQGLYGSAELPVGVTTLGGLEAAILAELGMPETSTQEPVPRAGSAGLLLLIAASGFVFAFRRFSQDRRAHRGGPGIARPEAAQANVGP